MKAKILFILMGMIFLLTGCDGGLTNEEIFEKTKNEFKNINTYQCKVKVEVTGNKESQIYEMNQFYKDQTFRLETLSPNHLEGKVVIIKDNKGKIILPNIDKSIIIDNFNQNQGESMFLGDFFAWHDAEDVEIDQETLNEVDYLVINKTNEQEYYHYIESLWINKKTRLPEYMKIYDREDNIRVELTIHDLLINNELEDELFILE